MSAPSQPHDSHRGHFAYHLYYAMEQNPNIWLIVGDLGYGMFDRISCDFKDRFINVGAAEQTMLDVAAGLAMEGKIPFVYTITPFLTRGYETIRNYINKEDLPVKMIGSGRDKDYKHDGFSHWSEDMKDLLKPFNNVVEYWPNTKIRMETLVPELVDNGKPSFVSLKR